MGHAVPLCCSSAAFKLLATQLPALNSSKALLQGAVAIARHQLDGVTVKDTDRQIRHLADTVRSRVHGRQPQALLAHLHDVLFDEQGFTGNVDDYYNPINSYLPAVLENKRGLPITLCLLYKLVADRLGIETWGVGLPGHFLIGMVGGESGGSSLMLIDCFAHGRILNKDEAHEQLIRQFGPEVEWSDEILQPVTHRQWLTRMIQNLLNVFGSEDRYPDVGAMLEMEMLLWPEQSHLQRDLGLVLARCGLSKPACVWLDRYLQSNPDDPQMSELMQLRDVLK
jgi:regulator of sirC expression with transglutaminase-like and TPR domain